MLLSMLVLVTSFFHSGVCMLCVCVIVYLSSSRPTMPPSPTLHPSPFASPCKPPPHLHCTRVHHIYTTRTPHYPIHHTHTSLPHTPHAHLTTPGVEQILNIAVSITGFLSCAMYFFASTINIGKRFFFWSSLLCMGFGVAIFIVNVVWLVGNATSVSTWLVIPFTVIALLAIACQVGIVGVLAYRCVGVCVWCVCGWMCTVVCCSPNTTPFAHITHQCNRTCSHVPAMYTHPYVHIHNMPPTHTHTHTHTHTPGVGYTQGQSVHHIKHKPRHRNLLQWLGE